MDEDSTGKEEVKELVILSLNELKYNLIRKSGLFENEIISIIKEIIYDL